jgi:mannosyltransferase
VRRAGLRWLFAAGVAGVVSLPFALEVVDQSGQLSWIHRLRLNDAVPMVNAQWFYTWWFAVPACALIVLGIVAALRSGRARQLLIVAVPGLAVPTLALILYSAVQNPIYQPRYLTMCAPFVALAIAAGIDAIRMRWATVVALVLLAALSLPSIIEQRGPEAKENTSWQQVAALIAAERAADGPGVTTAIVWGNVQHHPKATARVIAYSYPDAFVGTLDPTLLIPAAKTGQLWETRAPIGDSLAGVADADVVYFITSKARDMRAETTAALQRVGWHVAKTWNFTGEHVLRYERD